MLLTYAITCLALGYPALAGGFLVNPRSDQYIGGFPVREFAAASLKAGHGLPQWDPYLFGGMPYVASMNGDMFYPTAALRVLLPVDAAMTWGFIIHIFLAGVFTYLFLRAWEFDFVPSLLGGVAYQLTGFVASLVSPGHDGKIFVSTLLPLALWVLTQGFCRRRDWAWGALALIVGLAVLSPHPQLLQYLLLLCGAFALFVAFGPVHSGRRLDRREALRGVGLALVAVAVGLLIGAVQFLPVLKYTPWSPRASGMGWEHAISYSFPIEELINTYLPQFTGILDRYWGRNGIHLHSEYIGAVVLVLAGAGMGWARRNAFRWFWVGVLVIATLWALGGYTPFFRLVYVIVPGTKFFRAPSTIFVLAAFACAVLAAMGTERVFAASVSRRYLIGWGIASLAVALLATVGALTGLAQVIGSGLPTSERSLALIDENAGAVILGAWRSVLFVALALAAIWAVDRERISRTAGVWCLLVLTAVDLWSIERDYWQFSPPAAVLYASDPAIDYLRTAPAGRVLTLQLTNASAPRDANLGGDGLMVHDVRNLMGYHGNELGNFQRLMNKTDAGYDPRVFLSPSLWRHENVRYVYTDADTSIMTQFAAQLRLPAPFAPVLGPVRDAAGSTVYLYKTPGDNPPAWLAPVFVKASDEQALGTVLDPRFDPTRVAVVDTSATVHTQQIQALPPAIDIGVQVERYAPGDISLRLNAPVPSEAALVVSENYYPGWHAAADNRSLPVVRTDYNLIGVQLPAGTQQVHLTFFDASYATGRVITIIAIVLAALATLLGAVSDWRRRGRRPTDEVVVARPELQGRAVG